MILLDTSAWLALVIKRPRPEPSVTIALEEGHIAVHPWVIGELLLGGLEARRAALLETLPIVPAVEDAEVLAFIRRHRPRGVGWVDVHLLIAALDAGCQLLSRDRALADLANRQGCAARPPDAWNPASG